MTRGKFVTEFYPEEIPTQKCKNGNKNASLK